MPSPVRASFAIEPAASPEEIAAVYTVLAASMRTETPIKSEPAWRVAARREATGATF